jgi:hypothetical protein
MRRLRHDREIALPAFSPIWRMFWFYNEVGAVKTDCGTASDGIWRKPATATSSLSLEHTPAVLACVDAQVRFLEYELNVIAPELLSSAATERSVAGGDALAHLAGQPIGGKEPVEGRGRFDLPFVIDELMQIEIRAHVALGGHRHRDVLEMIGESEELRAIAPGHEAREGLAELMGREAPGTSRVPTHAIQVCELANPAIDVHVGDAHYLAVLRVAGEEELLAA